MMSLRAIILSSVVCIGILPAACSPDRPWMMEQSKITPNRIGLVEERYIVKKPMPELSSNDIADAARIYGRGGAGPMYVVIAHSAQGKSDHAMSEKMHAILAQLQSNGVASNDIIASTVPLDTAMPVALIAFDTLHAQGPADCTDMPGLYKLPAEESAWNYKLGCGVKTVMARQIADPRDLEGKAGLGGHNDGERAANIVTGYRTGETPRDYLPSYVISELAGSGQ